MSEEIPVASPPVAARDHARFSRAWLALTVSLAIHVIAEADYDFHAFFLPLVAAVRDRASFLPALNPGFSAWLVGLAIMVLGLLLLWPVTFRAGRGMRRTAYVLAGLTAANAVAHTVSSLHFNHLVPGLWSAHLLLLAAAYMFVAARRATPGHHLPLSQ